VVVAVVLPDVPVIVALYCPRVAELVAVSVTVLYPVAGFGENDALTPAGKPEIERLTLPVNPYSGLTYTEDIPE